jgi:hypothetical protein
MGKKVTISTEGFDKALAEIKEVDAKIVGLKGTAAEWQKKAKAATDKIMLVPSGVVALQMLGIDNDPTIGTIEALLTQAKAEADNARKELNTLWIKANRKDSDESTGLLARRAELVTTAEAMRNLFSQAGIDLPEVPKAPRLTGTSGSSNLTTPKGVQFWAKRELDEAGNVKPDSATYMLPSSNNSLGGVGWYVFKEASSESVQDALKTAGWDGTLTTSQQYGPITVTGKKGPRTAIVGWTVTAPEDKEVKADVEAALDAEDADTKTK